MILRFFIFKLIRFVYEYFLGILKLIFLLIISFLLFLGWFLIWKAFLSKFRLVRELLGQTNPDGTPATPEKSVDSTNSAAGSLPYAKVKKTRKD